MEKGSFITEGDSDGSSKKCKWELVRYNNIMMILIFGSRAYYSQNCDLNVIQDSSFKLQDLSKESNMYEFLPPET